MRLGNIKASIIEIIKSYKWILLKYYKLKRNLLKKYLFDKVELFNVKSWHIGYKYLLAYKDGKKYFIKIDSQYKIIKNEYIASKELRNNNKNINNFINVFEYGQYNGDDFVIMDFISGKTLENIMEDDIILEESQLVNIASQLIGILNGLQHCNIIHRDIRPANIIVENNGSNILLIDFTFAISLKNHRLKELNKNDFNIRLLNQLGDNYKKKCGMWDDAYSITKIIKELDSNYILSNDIYETLKEKNGLTIYCLGERW